MSSQDYDSRYRALIEPIRDLAQNWDIDISSSLEEYLRELEDIRIHIEGDECKLNFAEAALLIQGSTAIYCKKIDHLHNLVYKTLEVIAQKNRADIKNKCNSDLEEDSRKGKNKNKSELSLWNDDDPSYIMYDNEFDVQKNINISTTPQDLHLSDDVNMKYQSSSSTMLLFALLQDDQKQNTLKLSSSSIHPLFGILEIGIISKVDVSLLPIPSSLNYNTTSHKSLNDNNNTINNIHNYAMKDNNNSIQSVTQGCQLFHNTDDDDDNNDYEGFENIDPFEEKVGNALLETPSKEPLSIIGLLPPPLSTPPPLLAPSPIVEHIPAFLPPIPQPTDNSIHQSNNDINYSTILNDHNNSSNSTNNNKLVTPKKTTPLENSTPKSPPHSPHTPLNQTNQTLHNPLTLLDPHQPSSDSRPLKIMKPKIASLTKTAGKPPVQKQRLSDVMHTIDSPELPLDGLVYKHLEYWINAQNKSLVKKRSIRGKHSEEAVAGSSSSSTSLRMRNQDYISNVDHRDGVVSSSPSSNPVPNEMDERNVDSFPDNYDVASNYDDDNCDSGSDSGGFDPIPLPFPNDHNDQPKINSIQNYDHPVNIKETNNDDIVEEELSPQCNALRTRSPYDDDNNLDVDTHHNSNSNSSYEAICRKHIERFMLSAEAFARESALAGRVKEWTHRLEPQLREQDHRPTFDMHRYSARFLNKVVEVNQKNRNSLPLQPPLQKKNIKQNKHDESIDFSLLVDCHEHQYEVCRMFLACLQLANFGNIKIIKHSTDDIVVSGAIRTFSVGLVSDILNADIDNFNTLSLSK